MITRKTFGDTVVLEFRGKMTIGVGDIELRDSVRKEIDRGFRKIVLDLSKLTLIDSSGVGELVSAFTMAANTGAVIVIAGGYQNFPQKDASLKDILTINQLIDVFNLYPDAERAVTAFQNEET